MERPALACTIQAIRGGKVPPFIAGYYPAIAEPHERPQRQGEPVVKNNITFAALDTHKKEHKVAVIYPDTGELEEFTVRNNVKDVTQMARRVAKKAPGPVKFCYEAGVCGF